jgi:hypothetical protein
MMDAVDVRTNNKRCKQCGNVLQNFALVLEPHPFASYVTTTQFVIAVASYLCPTVDKGSFVGISHKLILLLFRVCKCSLQTLSPIVQIALVHVFLWMMAFDVAASGLCYLAESQAQLLTKVAG